MAALNLFFIFLLFTYSIPLGLAYTIYSLSMPKSVLLALRNDSIVLLLLILFSIYNHNLINFTSIINYPISQWEIFNHNGILEKLKHNFKDIPQIYTAGLFIVLSFPLVTNIIFNYFKVKRLKQHINQAAEIGFLEKLENIDGTLLGYTSNSEEIIISDKEMNQHCLIIGTTGSGKTTTILNFVDSALSRNLPCIYLDGKGSYDLVDSLEKLANKYNRKLRVFSLRPKDGLESLACYNPFSSGNATEWKNRIMSLFAQAEGKGQEHFSIAEQNYINFVSNVLYDLSKETGQSIDLKILLSFLENPDLILEAAKRVNPTMFNKLSKLYNDDSITTMTGDIVKLLELFIYSSYGELFNTSDKTNVINIYDSLINNEVVLFLFNASAYPEDSRKVAKMVINDINSSFASFEKFTPTYCIFDEFASYASSNLADSISLHRSNGMHAIIGTQSIASIKLKSLETRRIAEELTACCNTFIVQKLNHVEDAELFASIIGKSEQIKSTRTLYDRIPDKGVEDNPRVIGNVQLVEKFIINPQELKDLEQGEAVVYRKAAGEKPLKVKIYKGF